ncbi:metal-dependent hydrolase [Gordonia rubripertincta]|uniref:Metal-dependent hydrolase n=1 Tax=Gordonia rubripertincta TaxID=36822 RepID=A0ABT4MVK0_GORRU|nr:metal-dependent hydrolase [Gordonia rubripertincta]MCZ4551040.1 metal-dependent hydrolase [Gordonia rubripertincta]
MSDLHVRRIPFEFEDVEFMWNKANPEFAVFINAVSFWVMGLEHFLVKTMRDIDPAISDPEVAEEARLFLKQEAVHTACHRRHVKALIVRYPELSEALDLTIEHYDKLFRDSERRYRLAYGAVLEGTFTPFFKMIIDNRESLFGDGDARVASLCLWHFCEEIEHRSSAVKVYDHVVGDGYYKMRSFIPMVRHVGECTAMLLREFQKHVPGEPGAPYYGSVLTRRMRFCPSNPFGTIPIRERLAMVRGVGASVMPNYDHDNQPLPEWAATWFDHFDRGEDMTQFYGIRREPRIEQ